MLQAEAYSKVLYCNAQRAPCWMTTVVPANIHDTVSNTQYYIEYK